jgi:acetylornithine deacetylase/succinyl-diaminopimelate desuccinylase-like protein
MRTAMRIACVGMLPGSLASLGMTRLAHAQTPAEVRAKVRDWRTKNDVAIMRELTELLAIPNLASDSVNIRRNAAHLVSMLAKRGLNPRLLETPGSPPAVYGELRVPGATRTVMFYAHYDGQPVDTTQWLTPPWRPVLRDALHTAGGKIIEMPTTPGSVQGEWRLYARSSGDDKSPIVAMLAAIDALRAQATPLSVNLKFYLDGEEEAGNDHLDTMLPKYADLLKADVWLFGDGPVHQSRRPQIGFGVRGVTGLNLTVYGPVRGLHSGHYGNWVYNPVTLIANLVASMRDDEGRIKIARFYDDVAPITAAERAALATIPVVDDALKREFQVGGTEGGGARLNERIMLPALNLRGIRGGGVGALGSNTINTEAQASIDFRLVPNQTPARIKELVEAHLRAQGYHVLDRAPTVEERTRHPKIVRTQWELGYPAQRTALDHPVSRAVIAAAEDAAGQKMIVNPTSGGSLPQHTFAEILKAPLISVPIVNHDNNQHAANENLRLQNLWDGIELYAGMLVRLGAHLQPVRP